MYVTSSALIVTPHKAASNIVVAFGIVLDPEVVWQDPKLYNGVDLGTTITRAKPHTHTHNHDIKSNNESGTSLITIQAMLYQSRNNLIVMRSCR